MVNVYMKTQAILNVLQLYPTKQSLKKKVKSVNWKKRVGEKEAQRIVTEAQIMVPNARYT